jgi:NTP pyrophosphatase (non-canonical NTP hydrolase)
MNIELLQKAVGEWSRRNFPNNKPYQPLLGACEEVGELCHAHLKNEQQIRGFDSEEKTKSEKMDAIGDIVIYLADYCERNKLNLETSIEETWEKVKKRNWNDSKIESM